MPRCPKANPSEPTDARRPALADRGAPRPLQAVYVHVPYCRDRCTYCAFATVADRPDEHSRLIQALSAERERHSGFPASTLYLGGGTPGLLEPSLLQDLVAGVADLQPDAEVTLEVNPTNVTRDALRAWRDLGVTRLSVGVQTFADDVLRRFARRHDGEQAHVALEHIAAHWTGTWSADLLVGWAGQSTDDLREDLDRLTALAPPHVSVYALTVEPGTSLARAERAGQPVVQAGDALADLDAQIAGTLGEHGLERYEISNYAAPGHESRHNQVYWRNEDYLGLGPGASSSVGALRWENRRDTTAYLTALEARRSCRRWGELVRPEARLLECLAVGLRTRTGVPCATLDRRFTPAWRAPLARAAAPVLDAGALEWTDEHLRLPAREWSRADRILLEIVRGLEPLLQRSGMGATWTTR